MLFFTEKVHMNFFKKKKEKEKKESSHLAVSLFPGGERVSDIRINHTRNCVQQTLEKQHKFLDGTGQMKISGMTEGEKKNGFFVKSVFSAPY